MPLAPKLEGEHPFDKAENRGRSILVVGENFGSGSSREHAVPAIMQWGIEAIIGLSFADIFRGNATGNGLPCVTVSPGHHEHILEHLEDGDLRIDLETMTVSYASGVVSPCFMPEAAQESLITGRFDDIVVCQEAGGEIERTAARLTYFRQAFAKK